MKPPRKIVLPNGLRVVLVPQASSLAASVLVLVEAGSEYETRRLNGISHFLEHMTFKGTALRPRPGMIAEEFAALGAQSNAFTSQEFTGYWAKAEAKKLKKIMEIVTDLYLHPLLAPEEIEKERGVIVEELNMYEDTPTRKVQDLLLALLYGDQPAGWDVVGTRENVRRFTRDDFAAYRRARYVTSGTVVVIAGRFDEKAVLARIRAAFGGLPRRRRAPKEKTRERQTKPGLLVRYKKSDQGHLVLGFRAFDLFDRRRYALRVLADVLGGGMHSRLWKKIREELGAAYYLGADAELSLDHGFFEIAAGVDHAKVETVLRAVIDECRMLRDTLVPADELARTKDHMAGSIILGLETADELASFYGGEEILTGTLLPPEKIIDRIRKTTAEEVRAAARDVFRNEKMNLAAIGPYRAGEKKKLSKILTF